MFSTACNSSEAVIFSTPQEADRAGWHSNPNGKKKLEEMDAEKRRREEQHSLKVEKLALEIEALKSMIIIPISTLCKHDCK